MTAHAPLAPSSASRWGPGGCPGSAAMERRYPEDEESEPAREGTAAHWYLAESLEARFHPVGTLAPNGVPINAEMQDATQALRIDVLDTLRSRPSGSILQIEQRVGAPRTIHPDNWGTPDIYLLDAVERTLDVWDFKYGHRYVDAYRNWQMIDYAICILESHGVDLAASYTEHDSAFHWRITLTIAQPRNYAPEGPLREWYLSGAQLQERARELQGAARAASEPGAELRTGPHCRDCKAAAHCPALARAALSAVDYAHAQRPYDMSPIAVGLMLRILDEGEKRAAALRTALEAEAMATLQRGQAVPFYQLGRVTPRERWTVDAADVVGLGKLWGVDLAQPLAAITPPQARKKGIDAAVIAAYSERPAGAVKLLPFDDTAAARAFGQE